jgi:hypothetical protein
MKIDIIQLEVFIQSVVTPSLIPAQSPHNSITKFIYNGDFLFGISTQGD